MKFLILLFLLVSLFLSSVEATTECSVCLVLCNKLSVVGVSFEKCHKNCLKKHCADKDDDSDDDAYGAYDRAGRSIELIINAAYVHALHGKEKGSNDMSRHGDTDVYFPDSPTHVHVGGRWDAAKSRFSVDFIAFKVNGVGPNSPRDVFKSTYPHGRNLAQRADGKYDTSKLPAVLSKEREKLIKAGIGY
jgi:hypothetical protein